MEHEEKSLPKPPLVMVQARGKRGLPKHLAQFVPRNVQLARQSVQRGELAGDSPGEIRFLGRNEDSQDLH